MNEGTALFHAPSSLQAMVLRSLSAWKKMLIAHSNVLAQATFDIAFLHCTGRIQETVNIILSLLSGG